MAWVILRSPRLLEPAFVLIMKPVHSLSCASVAIAANPL
jgi:hypothetical protein